MRGREAASFMYAPLFRSILSCTGTLRFAKPFACAKPFARALPLIEILNRFLKGVMGAMENPYILIWRAANSGITVWGLSRIAPWR